jgi:hypothetical protein
MIRTPKWNLWARSSWTHKTWTYKSWTYKSWTRKSWTRKHFALAAAIVVLAAGGAYFSFGLARAKPFTSAVLSDQWQCTRTAGILTVCTRKPG